MAYRVHGVPNGTGAGAIALGVPGDHNLQNALAAVAVGLEIGIPFDRMRAALAEFNGAERRYQSRGRGPRDHRGGRLWAPPHGDCRRAAGRAQRLALDASSPCFSRIATTRTRDLLNEFGPALALADEVVLTDIYPAGEAPIAGCHADGLAAAVRGRVPGVHVVPRSTTSRRRSWPGSRAAAT